MQALLQWYGRVGFDGAPRFLGLDEQRREVLSYVEGEPAFAPVPSSGLNGAQRGSILDELIEHRRGALERGAFRGTARRETVLANLRWVEAHAPELGTFLA